MAQVRILDNYRPEEGKQQQQGVVRLAEGVSLQQQPQQQPVKLQQTQPTSQRSPIIINQSINSGQLNNGVQTTFVAGSSLPVGQGCKLFNFM